MFFYFIIYSVLFVKLVCKKTFFNVKTAKTLVIVSFDKVDSSEGTAHKDIVNYALSNLNNVSRFVV